MRLEALVNAYSGSADFMELAPASQSLYIQMIAAVKRDGGLYSVPVEKVSPKVVDSYYKAWQLQFGKSKAQMMCKVLRKIWNWGYRQELIVLNPWSKMNLKSIPARTQLWTKEDYLEARALSVNDVHMRVLLRALWETGQRPVDVLYFIYKTDIKKFESGYVVWITTQQKTGKQLGIEISEGLADELRAIGSFSTDFIRNYHNHFKTLKERGLNPSLQLRDIRRTVATEMAEGGATDEQIRALLGHSGHSKMPETVYIVRNAKMAADGLAKRHVVDYSGQIGCSCATYPNCACGREHINL